MRSFPWLCRLLWVALAGLLALSSVASADPEMPPLERPADGIHDPAGMLSPAERQRLGGELAEWRKSAGIDVMVVLTKEMPVDNPQAYAEGLAMRWGDAGGRVLILHTPIDPRSPWISISGRVSGELPRPVLDEIAKTAGKRARAAGSPAAAVRAAATAVADELRFLSARAGKAVAPPVKLRTRDIVFIFLRSLPKWLFMGVFTLMMGVPVLIFIVRRLHAWLLQRWPRTFPEVSWKARFGAPHGAAVITYSPKRKQAVHHHHNEN